MRKLRRLFDRPRRVFFGFAIIPILAFNFPANAWLFGLMLPAGLWWLAWGTACAFEASIPAIQIMLPTIPHRTSERRAAWVGLCIVLLVSAIANIGHDVQFFNPADSKAALWMDSIVPGAAWLWPVITGVLRPAILIVFSLVVATKIPAEQVVETGEQLAPTVLQQNFTISAQAGLVATQPTAEPTTLQTTELRASGEVVNTAPIVTTTLRQLATTKGNPQPNPATVAALMKLSEATVAEVAAATGKSATWERQQLRLAVDGGVVQVIAGSNPARYKLMEVAQC